MKPKSDWTPHWPKMTLYERIIDYVMTLRGVPYEIRYVWITTRKGQTCWTFCPRCEHDVSGHPDMEADMLPGGLIMLVCGTCSAISTWDYGTYPIPVLVA